MLDNRHLTWNVGGGVRGGGGARAGVEAELAAAARAALADAGTVRVVVTLAPALTALRRVQLF